MDCKDVQESLWDFLEGNAPNLREEIQKHLDGCLVCTREYQRLEQDMIQLKARRDAQLPDDAAWTQFLPAIRRKISMRETRRQTVALPLKRLVPLFAMMAIIAFLFHVKFPGVSEQIPADSNGFDAAWSPFQYQDYIDSIATLGISDSTLYSNLVGESSGEDLRRLDDWNSGGSDVIDELINLSPEERDHVFSQLEKKLI
jgi:hypothetical protein